MSIRIIKAGIMDSIQDGGRYGYQHLGINISGSMDRFAASLANALLGKDAGAPVFELHFPAAQIYFKDSMNIAITGAEFAPQLNGRPVPMNHPVAVPADSVLKFSRCEWGMRTYLATDRQLDLEPFLGSCSTSIKTKLGGIGGRVLLAGDVINCRPGKTGFFQDSHFSVKGLSYQSNTIRCIIGSEWNRLTETSAENFKNCFFEITTDSDRMGYRLAGTRLDVKIRQQMISSPAVFGTIQLLPGGQMIILMADHQVTGGYPRIASVISADLPLLAQKQPGSMIRFQLTDLAEAENHFVKQQVYLKQIMEAVVMKNPGS